MTRPSSHTAVRLLAVLLTVLAIAGREHLPPKVMQLYPDPDRMSWIYGPDHQDGPSTDWFDKEKGHFWCNFMVDDPYACGWSINLGRDRLTGLDLSGIDGFNITVYHEGSSPRIRLLLRDFDPAYSDIATFDVSSKVMSTAIRTSDLNKTVFVNISEFSVAEWWVTQFDVAREHSAPTLDNVIVFGFEFIAHGNNDVRVERVDAVGEWLKKETLYFGIISLWMALVIFEILLRLYFVHKKSLADAMRIERLASEYKKLEIEKQEFEELSTTDVLTGIMNRAGVQQFWQRLFEGDTEVRSVGLLLFDIDHFKRINDQFGHDVGDQVLTEVANIINQSIRQSDVFGRWGGEEFILLCPKISAGHLKVFADKLRVAIEEHVFETESHSLRVTVSVGATTATAEEGFQVAFKRADTALYKAKNSGRNRTRLARK